MSSRGCCSPENSCNDISIGRSSHTTSGGSQGVLMSKMTKRRLLPGWPVTFLKFWLVTAIFIAALRLQCHQSFVFLFQLFSAFYVGRILLDAFDGAYRNALRLIIMAYAFRAFGRVDDVNLVALR